MIKIKYLITILPLVLFIGCSSSKVVTVTKEVKIPVRCDIPYPSKDYDKKFTGNKYKEVNGTKIPTKEYLNYIKNKVINKESYINKLENYLYYCIYGTYKSK